MREFFWIVLILLISMAVFCAVQFYNTSEASGYKYSLVAEYAWQLKDDQTIKAAIDAALRDDYLSNYEFEEIRILVDNASKQKIKSAINAN